MTALKSVLAGMSLLFVVSCSQSPEFSGRSVALDAAAEGPFTEQSVADIQADSETEESVAASTQTVASNESKQVISPDEESSDMQKMTIQAIAASDLPVEQQQKALEAIQGITKNLDAGKMCDAAGNANRLLSVITGQEGAQASFGLLKLGDAAKKIKDLIAAIKAGALAKIKAALAALFGNAKKAAEEVKKAEEAKKAADAKKAEEAKKAADAKKAAEKK